MHQEIPENDTWGKELAEYWNQWCTKYTTEERTEMVASLEEEGTLEISIGGLPARLFNTEEGILVGTRLQ